eukprot:g1523.t1
MDLHSETIDVDLSEHDLDEIVEMCLCVKQDLTCANQTIATLSAETNQYPARKRATEPSNVQLAGPSRMHKKMRKDRGTAKKSVPPRISRPELLDARTNERRASRVDLVSEDETRDEIMIESEADGWNTEFKIPDVSLDQVVAAFNTWNENPESSEITSQLFTQSPAFLSTKLSLSPYDNDTWTLPESSKVPMIDLGGLPEQETGDLMMAEDHQKTPVGTESSTLPNGYNLQSLQLVLECEMEEDTNCEGLRLIPIIKLDSYAVASSLPSFIPIYKAPLKWIQEPVNFDSMIPVEPTLAAPALERVDTDKSTFTVNVMELFARMNKKCSDIHPMIVPQSLDTNTLNDEIDHLFTHLLSSEPFPEFQFHDVRSSMRDKVCDRGGSESEDEEQLKALLKKLDDKFNPIQKNELSK